MMRRFLLLFLTYACTLSAQNLYELQKIDFVGNNFFSANILKDIIYSEESPPWYWKFLNSFSSLGKPAQYFDSTLIQTDLRAIQNFYNDKGFFTAEVGYAFSTDSSDESAILTFYINEKNASQYGRVKFEFKKDIPVHLQDKLYIDLDVDSTYRYDVEKLQLEIKKSLELLTNNGFMLAKFDSTIIARDTINNRANITLYMDPGERYTISDIRIEKSGRGSSLVSDRLLREVAAIQPGEYYSREKVGKSQMRLFRTGLFNAISLNPSLDDSVDNTIPLRLSGSIDYLNELAPEIIADNEGNSFNLGLGASYIRKNFLGDARKFTLSTKFGIIDILNFNFGNIFKKPEERDSTFQAFLNVSAKVEQPYLFNKPIYGSVEFYGNLITILKTTLNNAGGKLMLDFEMPSYTFVSLLQPYYNIEFLEFIPYLGFDNVELKIHSLVSAVGTEVGTSRIDDIFFPTTGNNNVFLFETAVSNTGYKISGNEEEIKEIKPKDGETTYFYKTQLTNAFYFPLNYRKTLVFGAKLKAGYIQTFEGMDELIPPNRTFFAGGSNSVRGWRARELTPDDSIQYYGLTFNNDYTDNVLGGTFLFEGSFEYRIRFLKDYGLTFFTDYGNTWNGYQDFRFDEIAVAIGFGLRYFSSIAPFRLDFGFKFYNPEDQKLLFEKPFFQQLEFHFAIGESF
jgi:outer membrane protein insertion porin family